MPLARWNGNAVSAQFCLSQLLVAELDAARPRRCKMLAAERALALPTVLAGVATACHHSHHPSASQSGTRFGRGGGGGYRRCQCASTATSRDHRRGTRSGSYAPAPPGDTGSAQRYPSSGEAAAGGVAAAHGMLRARVLVLSRLVPDGVVVPRVVLLVELADGPWGAAAEVGHLEALLGARHAQQHEQQQCGPPAGAAGARGGAH